MLVLGVGAQKSGTSWLYHQLANQPGFRSLGSKELHFWDDLYGVRSREFAGKKFMENFLQSDSPEHSGLEGFSDGGQWFAQVEQGLRLVRTNRSSLVADITPSYSGLPLFAMKQIAEGLQSRSIDYRVIYLIRDPLSRISSAIQMNLQRTRPGDLAREEVRRELNAEEMVLHYATSWQNQFRTRYELTLSNLEQAFDLERIFVGFFEQIRTGETASSLEGFLGISFDRAHRNAIVNKGGNRLPGRLS